MHFQLLRVSTVLAFLTAAGAAGSAHAVTGYVSGSWSLWNQNGNYCPSSNTCTGSWYTQAGYDTWQPISNAIVWVVDSSDAIIGYGSTDDNGGFLVSWTRSTFPTQIGVVILPYHKDGRFYMANSLGQWINNWFGLVNTASGTTVTSPQNVGSWGVGGSTWPDPFYNAYWAAEWQWRWVMNAVGVLQSNFTNVEVRGFADTISGYLGSCSTSCAWGPFKQVQLDSNAGFAPQARVMHEIGHIASYVTHPWQITTDYSWGGSGGWCQTCAEWSVSSFEESFATHYGSITFWADDSTSPTTCLSSGTCYSSGTPFSGTNLEASSYPYNTNNCDTTTTNPESRWPLSMMRYLWDVYDNHNDADGDSYSASQSNFWEHLHNLAWYPEGTSTDEIDEPWNSTYTSVTEPDGRGGASYASNYLSNVTDTYLLRTDNCTPP